MLVSFISQVYKLAMSLVASIVRLKLFQVFISESKIKSFIEGQQALLENIEREMKQNLRSSLVIWVHVSSLGEYGVARPIIQFLKNNYDCNIILTFFSPTGYDVLKRRHPYIDNVFYLPIDTINNVKRFLDIVKPHRAVFVKSEYWYNYLMELRRRDIPIYLVSAKINGKSVFFKWYGCLYKQMLGCYNNIMLTDSFSKKNLERLGYTDALFTGDPLFDNVINISRQPWDNAIISRFAIDKKVFVAGSISDDKDLELVSYVANKHKDTRFIIVPHEICEETLNEIKYNMEGKTLLYSECNDKTDFTDTQVLVIDFLGALAHIYKYGSWAYVGGGFTPYLHNLIEAAVYGLPVAFGPRIERKATPLELVRLGTGCVVKNRKEINRWFKSLKYDDDKLKRISVVSKKYVECNAGATSIISKIIADGHN